MEGACGFLAHCRGSGLKELGAQSLYGLPWAYMVAASHPSLSEQCVARAFFLKFHRFCYQNPHIHSNFRCISHVELPLEAAMCVCVLHRSKSEVAHIHRIVTCYFLFRRDLSICSGVGTGHHKEDPGTLFTRLC